MSTIQERLKLSLTRLESEYPTCPIILLVFTKEGGVRRIEMTANVDREQIRTGLRGIVNRWDRVEKSQ